MKITGNSILITGGGSGIGRALAEALHARGNRIIIAGRRADALAEVAAANPGMATITLDIADEAAIGPFAERLIAEHPDLNGVIHNAGIMQVEREIDGAIARATIATNLVGPILLTEALLPHLRAQADAVIATVTSGLAFVPLPATPTYSATKAALHSWTQSLRVRLADAGIHVMEIAPPGVATDLMPGHAENPQSMPLADYIAEVMALIEADPHADEILVERVKPLRFAERDGTHGQMLAMLSAY
jgi:uncharacterized oxidoreductase